jgi:hypothetical protein
LHELDHDPVWIGHLEEPLAPRLGLERGRDLDPASDQSLMVGVDITHDEHHQQTTGRSLLGFGLERREPGPQEDEIEARVRSAEGMEAVAAHLRGKAERAVMNAAEASGSATLVRPPRQ